MALDARRYVLACIAVTLLMRLPFVGYPLGIDEGGYAFVAASWNQGHGGIYGAQWVDRPPLLIALYAAALHVAGDAGVRLMGCIAAAVVVACCAGSAGQLAGLRAMRWTGLVAAVLASATATQAHTVNAEMPAIAFTSLAVWCTIRACASDVARRGAWGFAAGVAAMGGVLVKQSFVDGFAFGLVFLVTWGVCARRANGQRYRAGAAARVVVGGLAGAGLVLGATIAWAELHGPGFTVLLHALYGFRLEARTAMESAPNAPDTRFWFLFVVVACTGMASLLAYVVVGLARIAASRTHPGMDDDRDAVLQSAAVGLLAMGGLGLTGVLLGGNWWLHYLIQLAPFLAMGAGIVMATQFPGRWLTAASARRWTLVLVATTMATWCVTLVSTMTQGPQRTPTALGDWLRSASRPGDTALVSWGHPNVLHRSGLATPYRLAWSLPVRVQDPQLDELQGILRGQRAPTWIVQWRAISSWGLDSTGRVRTTLWRRYERLPDVCGKAIYRLRSRSGAALPPDPAGGCHSERRLSVNNVKLL